MLVNFMLLTAEGAGAEAGAMGQTLYMMVSFGLLFAVVYFMMIRPQKKKEKAAKSMRDNLQIGDEVTTIGGIVGIIVRKAEDTVVIETGGDKSKIRVKTWAISENATIHDELEAKQSPL
ncbi:MAG: preprotein translocase subunit YajC [Oscillospiraceae bacterium]|nr:preprotein translocase subunit YajC [Oscillospiraceae bacterium]